MFKRLASAGDDAVVQLLLKLAGQLFHATVGFRLFVCPSLEVNLNLAAVCQYGRLDIRGLGIDGRDASVACRLSHGNPQHLFCDELRGKQVFQSREALRVEQRLQFVRRSRKQHDVSPIAVPMSWQPLPGGRAIGIAQQDRSIKNVCLTSIVLRHRHAAFCKALVKFGDNLRVAMQLNAQSFSNALSR